MIQQTPYLSARKATVRLTSVSRKTARGSAKPEDRLYVREYAGLRDFDGSGIRLHSKPFSATELVSGIRKASEERHYEV